MSKQSPRKRPRLTDRIAEYVRPAGNTASVISGNPAFAAAGNAISDMMETDTPPVQQQTHQDAPGGSAHHQNNRLAAPHYKHTYDVTVTKTTQVTLTDDGNDCTYFFPTALYDWWLTEPNHNTDYSYYTYNYIPAYVDLLFYKDVNSRQSRTDFFHFVRPLHASVTCKDLLFFADDSKSLATPTIATYGFESAYLLFAERYLPEESSLSVFQPTSGYISNTLFAKQTLPRCVESKVESMDSQNIQLIHGGGSFGFSTGFHDPLPGNLRFVKPLRNYYANQNQGSYTNFTWMPFRNRMFTQGDAVDKAGNKIDDAKYWCNYSGHSKWGFPPPAYEMANKAYLVWFPRIPKADGNDFKIRCSFMMTTSATFRLYSKFPTHTSEAYITTEAKMGQLYKYGSYNTFTSYPITPTI